MARAVDGDALVLCGVDEEVRVELVGRGGLDAGLRAVVRVAQVGVLAEQSQVASSTTA